MIETAPGFTSVRGSTLWIAEIELVVVLSLTATVRDSKARTACDTCSALCFDAITGIRVIL